MTHHLNKGFLAIYHKGQGVFFNVKKIANSLKYFSVLRWGTEFTLKIVLGKNEKNPNQQNPKQNKTKKQTNKTKKPKQNLT